MAACLPAGALIRFSTFSCAMIDAFWPTAVTAVPNAAVRGKKPAADIFSLPPTCSASALVFMMKRSGFGDPGELVTELMYGLDQPQVFGQFTPKQALAERRRHRGVGQLAQRRQHLVGHRRRAGVDQQHAFARPPTP